MGSRTGIAWTDATWNPWRGCTKVSAGCRECYMYREQRRYGNDPAVVVRASRATFTAPLRWREPRKVFVCSWSDFFHEAADEWRRDALSVMEAAPQHTYQITTKRPERFGVVRPEWWPPKLWLGVSCEDQPTADARISLLPQTPAAVPWASLEPLLGPVDLDYWLTGCGGVPDPLVGWVVVGGESGLNARPCDVAWIRGIVRQCRAARVPVFVKQDSGLRPGQRGRIPNELWAIKEFPA